VPVAEAIYTEDRVTETLGYLPEQHIFQMLNRNYTTPERYRRWAAFEAFSRRVEREIARVVRLFAERFRPKPRKGRLP
jgi:hypothetical protein